MCGRFTETKVDPGLVAARFGVRESAVPGETLGRFNVCPTEPVLAVTAGAEARALRWGLIPPWARKLRAGPEPINARASRCSTSACSRRSIGDAAHRCLVVADGWYEWLKPERPRGQRVPFRYTVDGGELFAFAGLWHEGRLGDERIASVTILTTDGQRASARPSTTGCRACSARPTRRRPGWRRTSTPRRRWSCCCRSRRAHRRRAGQPGGQPRRGGGAGAARRARQPEPVQLRLG